MLSFHVGAERFLYTVVIGTGTHVATEELRRTRIGTFGFANSTAIKRTIGDVRRNCTLPDGTLQPYGSVNSNRRLGFARDYQPLCDWTALPLRGAKLDSTMPPNISLDLTKLVDAELVQLRAGLDVEMRRRGIAFSVGAVGERLVVDYFLRTPRLPNLQPAPTGTKNVDALSRDGDRYSIKTICNGKKTGTVYPDAIDPDKRLFEYLLIARLSESWLLLSIHQFTWSQFLAVRAWIGA